MVGSGGGVVGRWVASGVERVAPAIGCSVRAASRVGSPLRCLSWDVGLFADFAPRLICSVVVKEPKFMTQRKDSNTEALVVPATAAAAAAVVTGPAAPAAWALAAVAQASYRRIGDAIGAWNHDKERRWLEAAGIELGGLPPDDVLKFFAEFAEQEWSRRTVFEAMRALLDCIDDAVVPSIGRLTGQYGLKKRSPDRFFRGMVRFLADLSSSEFSDFQSLMRDIAQAPVEFDPVGVLLQSMASSAGGGFWATIPAQDADGRHWCVWLTRVADPVSLTTAIRMHGLNRETKQHRMSDPDSPMQLMFQRSRVNDIIRVIQPPPAPPPPLLRSEEGAPVLSSPDSK